MKLNKETLNKSAFIKKWKKDMMRTMRTIEPDWTDEDMEPIINEMLLEQTMIPEVTLDNNVTGERRETNILSVFDWAMTRDPKPIISGNGTFYKNQHEALNPIAAMLEYFLGNRKAVKKQMFKIEDKTSAEYQDKDREQLNWKILTNSYYGASGMPKSAFYSLWSGPRFIVGGPRIAIYDKKSSLIAGTTRYVSITKLGQQCA